MNDSETLFALAPLGGLLQRALLLILHLVLPWAALILGRLGLVVLLGGRLVGLVLRL